MNIRPSLGLTFAFAISVAFSFVLGSLTTSMGLREVTHGVGAEAASGTQTATAQMTVPFTAFKEFITSTHNGGDTVESDDCGTYVGPVADGPPAEDRGIRVAGRAGSYVTSLDLPKGAKVTELRLIGRDDAAADMHAHLYRKTTGSLTTGYLEMARAKSAGAREAVRYFLDTTIDGAQIDTTNVYGVELVLCDGVLAPTAVRITYSFP